MRGLPRPFLLLATLLFAFTASRARAWTDATVRTGTAEITLRDDGYADVSVRARIRVNGGWLEAFDIEGLDRDAVLDPERPPTFVDEAGVSRPMEFTPRPGGRLQLRFRRAGAPRRGEYEIALHYRTHLDGLVHEQDDGSLEVSWVFPAWRYGLDDVEVAWLAPQGTQPFDADTEASPIEIVTASREGRERILYRRAHLPRTSEWATRVHVPHGAWAYVAGPVAVAAATEEERVGDVSSARPALTEAAPDAAPVAPPWVVALLLSALAVGAALKVRGLALRARLTPSVRLRPLLPLGTWVRAVLLVVTLGAAAATLAWPVPPELSIGLALACAALGWHRTQAQAGQPRMAQLQPIPAATQRDAARDAWRPFFALDSLVDPTRLGLVSTGAVLTLVVLEGDAFARALGAAFLLLVMGATTRSLGKPFHAIRAALHRAQPWRKAGHVVQLVGRVTTSFGRAQPADEVRVRVTLKTGSLDLLGNAALLHVPEASPEQLEALDAWASERNARFDAARRLVEMKSCSPAEARELDQQLLRAIREVPEDATLEDTATTLQEAAE